MRGICDELGVFQKPRRYLISSLTGENLLVATPLLEWYLSKGFEVTNLEYFIRFEPKEAFRTFAERVTSSRRQADAGGSSIKADVDKANG